MLKILKSKTIIVGLLEIAGAVISYIQGEVVLGNSLTITGILTIILRTVTTKSLSEK